MWYVSRVNWSNPGKGVAPPTPQCCSYWKGSLQVTFDYSRQLSILSDIPPTHAGVLIYLRKAKFDQNSMINWRQNPKDYFSKIYLLFVNVYLHLDRAIGLIVGCSPMVLETVVQSQVESYQRLKKWLLMPPCLTLNFIRYGSRVNWSNPGNGVVPSPTDRCSSYWKESLRVILVSVLYNEKFRCYGNTTHYAMPFEARESVIRQIIHFTV